MIRYKIKFSAKIWQSEIAFLVSFNSERKLTILYFTLEKIRNQSYINSIWTTL